MEIFYLPIAFPPEKMSGRKAQVLMLQASGAGTTGLMRQFKRQDSLQDDPAAEIVEVYCSTVGVDDHIIHYETIPPEVPVTLHFWEFGGQTRFDPIRESYFKHADAFVLVYDISCPSTFDELKQRFLPALREQGDPSTPVYLIGTKADLRAEPRQDGWGNTLGVFCFIPTEEVQAWADSEGIVFLGDEVSGKTGVGVAAAFLKVANGVAETMGLPGIAKRIKPHSLPAGDEED